MIRESEIATLGCFGKVHNGLYSDYDKYCIIREDGQWSLWYYNEVNGDMVDKIVDIESMEHLKSVYESLENEELI